MELSLQQIIELIPEQWCWCVEQPPSWNKAVEIKRKKRIKKRYTAYISNEFLFGEKMFISSWGDNDDMCEALMAALLNVKKGIVTRVEELRKNKIEVPNFIFPDLERQSDVTSEISNRPSKD